MKTTEYTESTEELEFAPRELFLVLFTRFSFGVFSMFGGTCPHYPRSRGTIGFV